MHMGTYIGAFLVLFLGSYDNLEAYLLMWGLGFRASC